MMRNLLFFCIVSSFLSCKQKADVIYETITSNVSDWCAIEYQDQIKTVPKSQFPVVFETIWNNCCSKSNINTLLEINPDQAVANSEYECIGTDTFTIFCTWKEKKIIAISILQ